MGGKHFIRHVVMQKHLEPSRAQEPPPAGMEGVCAPIVLSEIVASLAADDRPESLLDRFLSTVVRLSGASGGAVRILTPGKDGLRLVCAVGLPPEVRKQEHTVGADCGVCGAALQQDRVNWNSDLRICAEHSDCGYFGGDCRQVLAVPVKFKGKTLGVYTLFMDLERAVPPEMSQMLHLSGELLGLALENARLTQENLRASLMNERQMMANEIHDSLAQTLHFIKMRIAALDEAIRQGDEARPAKYAAEIGEAVDTAYTSLRQLLTHFRNRMDPQGLVHALQETAEKFHSRTGIVLDFANSAPDLDLAPDQEVQVFHIVQEALTNIGKHSRARHARLTLDRRNGQYEITVEDDGAGLHGRPPGTAGSLRESRNIDSFGINVMRERARHLGGSVEIESLAGRGTRLRLQFPATGLQREASL
jgi:two-component system, NarL family, nitrate/nitrite sensor histidine kinase NarX